MTDDRTSAPKVVFAFLKKNVNILAFSVNLYLYINSSLYVKSEILYSWKYRKKSKYVQNLRNLEEMLANQF